MLRFSLLLSILFFSGSHLFAQGEASSSGRLAVQELNPEDAQLLMENKDIDDFSRTLQSLKSAYSAKDAGRVVAYQAKLLLAMRTEIDEASARAGSEAHGTSNARLEKMNLTLQYFDQPAFNPTDPTAAAKDFAQLDAFLLLMQEGLAELKAEKR